MKIPVFILIILLSVSFSLKAQKNSRTLDTKSDKEILIGICDREGLTAKPFSKWFKKEYRRYHPKRKIINRIKKDSINKFDIVIVMATWCGDSQREVPRFYKILDKVNYDESKLIVMCVDRNKEAPKARISKLNIERVPTIIIYLRGKEIGRIIETPEKNLEEDLLKFIGR